MSRRMSHPMHAPPPAAAVRATPSRDPPGSFFCGRRRVLTALAALPLAGCSPRLNWREHRVAEARCVIALPDKPQTAQRELDFNGRKVAMSMTSTGVGPSLFALGVAQLPPEALTAEQVETTLGWFRDGLLRNVQGTLTATRPLQLVTPPGRTLRAAQAVEAQGRIGADRKARLAARFYVVDDRLYQVVALAAEGELTADALATFFDSFRLTD
jgi:hypothetical protein